MKASKINYVIAQIDSFNTLGSKYAEKVKKDRKQFYLSKSSDIELLQWSKIKGHDFHFEIEKRTEIEYKKAILRKKVEKLERHAYAPELNTLWFKSGKCRKAYQCTTIEDAIAHVISPIHGNEMTIEDCKAI